MPKPNGSISHLSVMSDSLEEAVPFVVEQLQAIVVEQGARGFVAPVLTQESVELVDGVWTRVFEFSAEILQAVK